MGTRQWVVTEERMQSVDFVSYYRAGSTWAVKKGNPKKLDTSDMEARNRMMRNMATTIERIPQANRALQQCMVDMCGEILSGSTIGASRR